MSAIKTITNLEARALAEFRAVQESVAAQEAERREQARAREQARLRDLIAKYFAVEAEPTWNEEHDHAEIRIDEYVFVLGNGYIALYLLDTCGACGAEVGRGVDSLIDLGAVVAGESTALWVPGESTEYGPLRHSCPRRQDEPDPMPRIVMPTVEERLLDALRDFIAQREA